MLSMKEPVAPAQSNRTVAVYKGLKVAVYTGDKTEISLTRQDLVELVNVCNLLFIYVVNESFLGSLFIYRLSRLLCT